MSCALLIATALTSIATPQALADINQATSAQVYLMKARDLSPITPKIKMKRAWLRSFKKLATSRKSYKWPKDGRRKRCRFMPHLAVVLEGTSKELHFCFDCNDVRLDERLIDFQPARRRFAKLFLQAFPKHRPLRAIAQGKRDVEWTD